MPISTEFQAVSHYDFRPNNTMRQKKQKKVIFDLHFIVLAGILGEIEKM